MGQSTRYGIILLSLGVAACGTPAATFEHYVPATAGDVPGSATPATPSQSLVSVSKAAANGAIVINVPISRLVVTLSSKNQTTGQDAMSGTPGQGPSPNKSASLAWPSQPSRRNAALGLAGPDYSPTQSPYLIDVASSSDAGSHRTVPRKPSTASPPAPKNNGTKPPAPNAPAPPAPAAVQGISITAMGASGTYTITVLPTESTDGYYRVTPVNDFWSSNQLGVTKISNTDIPSSVQNTFTDMTSQRITEAGQLIAGASSIMTLMGNGGKHEVCDGDPPNFTADVATISNQSFKAAPPQDCWTYSIAVGAGDNKPDAITRADFNSAIKDSGGDKREVGFWPVTSCVDATLVLQKKGVEKPELQVSLRIIDPRYLRLLQIPDKGSITMDSICGAELTNTPIDRWGTGFDAISGLMTQVQSIAGKK